MSRLDSKRSAQAKIAAQGEPMVWLSGGMFAIACLMILSLLAFVLWQGLWTLWPRQYSIYSLKDGRLIAGELYSSQTEDNQKKLYLRTGNYDVTNRHFSYVSSLELTGEASWADPELWLVERKEWGNLYGYPKELSWGKTGPEDFAREISVGIRDVSEIDRELAAAKQRLQRIEPEASEETMSKITARIAELESKRSERRIVFELPILRKLGTLSAEWSEFSTGKVQDPQALLRLLELESDANEFKLAVQPIGTEEFLCKMSIASQAPIRLWVRRLGETSCSVSAFQEHSILLADIVRFFPPNRLGLLQRLGVYASRWWEFVSGAPREAGMEGGFFPAIWGTVVMTIIMSMAVMPFGVLAALYMREYARSGWLLSAIRISINNLAGVPSIVYGVFGLSFFCYIVGGYIDGGPTKAGFEPWPSSVWFSALTGLSMVGLAAFATSVLLGQAEARRSPLRAILRWAGGLLWLMTLAGIVWLLIKTPHFQGFYQAQLPNPTFGKGCLLWAALTLALLTLPVVIVATEEALSAVPNSLREGSYACGAGKWQTIYRIVLPCARPGIITGFILAMARGAGEVAPMMLVGAIPLATDLPLDSEFPFLHGSRSFMHLGFQIYSLGFQSQNSEAAKPMVYTATLLLLVIVTLLNQTAIWLRARLRKRFQTSQF